MARRGGATPATGGVQSVHRALDLVEAIAARGGPVPVGELAEATGLTLPTAHRLLRTLVDRGYARQLADRRYALGFAHVPLGSGAVTAVGAGSTHALARLVEALGETANLAVLDGDQVVYVAQAPGRHSMRMFTEVGRRVDAHCTAVGKALLAQMPSTEVQELLARSGLARRTAATLTDADALLAELATVRDRGYAVDDEEQEVGVRCVAVVVPRAPVPLGVSVSGPAPRMSDEVVRRAVPLLARAAREVAAAT